MVEPVKRGERRARQREANAGRAAEMHKARLNWQRARLFEPPVEGEATLDRFYVGCSGWFYWHWRGRFYPNDLPTRCWFERYSQSFNTVELNAPFYSWPMVATVKSWIRQAGDRPFVYTVKVSELITHVKRFHGTKTLVRDFGHIADLLGPRMGCFLFQLPPSYEYSPARLRDILAQLDPARRNVVEFRHATWWNPRVFDAFRKSGTIFCSTSGPNLPDDLIATDDEVYIRFHGSTNWYRDDYSAEELAAWSAKVRACGAGRVWAYFNNDHEAHAVENARDFYQLLRNG